jgi:hypothetical protein
MLSKLCFESSQKESDVGAAGDIILQEVLGTTNRLLSLILHGPH